MKHIKKKFYFESSIAPTNEITNIQLVDRNDSKAIKNVKKSTVPFIITSEGKLIMSMFYNDNGKETVIPIPDFTLIYYNNAYLNNISRKEKEKELYRKLRKYSDGLSEDVTEELYAYVGLASSSIIQMFTSLESFINSLIPDNQCYIIEKKNIREEFNKIQIQRNFDFWKKVKEVLPYFYSKSYFQTSNVKNSHIINLKTLRDEIVHTKSDELFEVQSKLLEKLLKFKYEETFDSIRLFMNFYKKDYILDCDCNKDF